MMTMKENEALYLFYLAGSECSKDVQGSGVSDADRLVVHRHAEFVALLSVVPIDDFCGPDAEGRLCDLGWVSERALRHERVIEQGFHCGPVLPARFGTLFSSLQALERFIEENRRTIANFLRAVRGQEEWGIKVLLERATAKKWLSAQIATAAAGETPASPGLRYVRERRAQAAAEKELQRWLLNSCESVTRSLDDYATDRCQRKILDGTVAGGSRELVLNLAALIPHERLKELFSHIEAINAERAEQGLSFVLNGPWPPYSFCPSLVMPL